MKKLLLFALLFASCGTTVEIPEEYVENDEVIANTDLLYVNEELGFMMKFPMEWEGYISNVQKDSDIYVGSGEGYTALFGFESDPDLFAVYIMTHEGWEEISQGGIVPTYLDENADWVFAGGTGHDASDEMMPYLRQASEILDTLSAL